MRAKALVTGLDVIQLICSRGAAGFGFLKRELGTSASTLSAVLRELAARGFILKEGREYKLGPVYPRLSAIFMRNFDLKRLAEHTLHDLGEKTRETVELSMPLDDGILLLNKIEPVNHVRIFAEVGDFHRILHRTASGKVCLAYCAPAARNAYYLNPGLVPNTNRTITSPEGMEREIETIRHDRLAIDVGENLDYVFRIAAPILNHSEELVGIVGIAGDLGRVDESKRAAFADLVRTAGTKLSNVIGGV